MGRVIFAHGELVQCRVGDVAKRMHIFVWKSILEVAQKACYFVVLMATEEKK
jgi:hypothetical protein